MFPIVTGDFRFFRMGGLVNKLHSLSIQKNQHFLMKIGYVLFMVDPNIHM